MVTQTLSALRRLGIVIAIGVAFLFGLATTVYLSLRSPEVTVPEVVGKDRFVAENALKDAGLNFRVRATRPSNQVKSDTVIFQLPRAGDVVKAGQTVAVDIARTAKEGEAADTVASEAAAEKGNNNLNAKDSSSAGNVNKEKPKRNKNTNTNANANGNGNRNGNANTPNANARSNVNKGNTNSEGTEANNDNRGSQTEKPNSNRSNRNANRSTPPAAPTPPERR